MKGTLKCSNTDEISVLYLGEAEEALGKAHALVKNDQAILSELEKVRGRLRGKREKEKKAFKKMFS